MDASPRYKEEIIDSAFTAIVFSGIHGLDPENDNVDVEVKLRDGTRYSATFFTPASIMAIMERYRKTGECRHGLYFWAVEMIVVERLTLSTVRQTIEDLLNTGEFSTAFAELGEGLDLEEEGLEG